MKMTITPKSGGVKQIQIKLNRDNGGSYIGFHTLGTSQEAILAGFQAIEENEQEELLALEK